MYVRPTFTSTALPGRSTVPPPEYAAQLAARFCIEHWQRACVPFVGRQGGQEDLGQENGPRRRWGLSKRRRRGPARCGLIFLSVNFPVASFQQDRSARIPPTFLMHALSRHRYPLRLRDCAARCTMLPRQSSFSGRTMTSSFVYPGGTFRYRGVPLRARHASAGHGVVRARSPISAEWRLVQDNSAPGYVDPGPPRRQPDYLGQIVAVPAVPAPPT
jgi:hypothetical protein